MKKCLMEAALMVISEEIPDFHHQAAEKVVEEMADNENVNKKGQNLSSSNFNFNVF